MSATAASAQDAGAAGSAAPARKVYRASGGRRTFFSFVFLILLPFFLSLPGMLFMRVKHGHIADSIGLTIFAVAFAAIMFLVLIDLLFSVRARVDLGPEKVKMTLPAGRGPTPMLRYKTYEVPYDSVHSIETRREIYGGAMLPVLLKGARLTLKDGSTIKLGYVSEANVDPMFPYPEIARQIADRARLPVIDRGSVHRSLKSKMLGLKAAPKSGADSVGEGDIAALNHSHSNVMLGLIGGLVVLMVIGLVADITATEPISRLPAPVAASSAAKLVKPPVPAVKPASEPKPKS